MDLILKALTPTRRTYVADDCANRKADWSVAGQWTGEANLGHFHANLGRLTKAVLGISTWCHLGVIVWKPTQSPDFLCSELVLAKLPLKPVWFPKKTCLERESGLGQQGASCLIYKWKHRPVGWTPVQWAVSGSQSLRDGSVLEEWTNQIFGLPGWSSDLGWCWIQQVMPPSGVSWRSYS